MLSMLPELLVMRLLHCKRLHLWPRFHVRVAAVLDAHQPIVEELSVPLTSRGSRLQQGACAAARRVEKLSVSLSRALSDTSG